MGRSTSGGSKLFTPDHSMAPKGADSARRRASPVGIL